MCVPEGFAFRPFLLRCGVANKHAAHGCIVNGKLRVQEELLVHLSILEERMLKNEVASSLLSASLKCREVGGVCRHSSPKAVSRQELEGII